MTENDVIIAVIAAWTAVRLATITARARQAARRDNARTAKAGTP